MMNNRLLTYCVSRCWKQRQMDHQFKVNDKKKHYFIMNVLFFILSFLVLDCKKRLFDEDDSIDRDKENIDNQQRNSIKKQKVIGRR